MVMVNQTMVSSVERHCGYDQVEIVEPIQVSQVFVDTLRFVRALVGSALHAIGRLETRLSALLSTYWGH